VLEADDDVFVTVAVDLEFLELLVLVELVLEIGGHPIGLVRDRLSNRDHVDQMQAALQVEPQLDLLGEVLLEKNRLPGVRHQPGDQVHAADQPDDEKECGLPPPGPLHATSSPRPAFPRRRCWPAPSWTRAACPGSSCARPASAPSPGPRA